MPILTMLSVRCSGFISRVEKSTLARASSSVSQCDGVRAYSVAQTHYGLAFISAAYGMEFARADFECSGVEIFGHHIHSRGVAYENYAVGKLVGVQMEVENCPVGVDYEF